MKAIILGAGISGISLAHFLQNNKKIKKNYNYRKR